MANASLKKGSLLINYISNSMMVGNVRRPDGDFWMATLVGTTSSYGYGLTVDSTDNVYITGMANSTANTSYATTAKYNTSGVLQWQRQFGTSGYNLGYSITLDSIGNVIVAGQGSNPNATQGDALVIKYNTSGVLQWQRALGGASLQDSDRFTGVATDSSDNIYAVGISPVTTTGLNKILNSKFNSSGTRQWTTRLANTGGFAEIGYGIARDSANNFYICAAARPSTGRHVFQIAKYNTSGAIQFQRSLSGTNENHALAIAVDSSTNIYACGHSNASGSVDIQIAKYNSSGVVQWQRRLGGTGNHNGNGIAFDSLGNVYVSGYSDSSGTNDFQLVKYNSSGVIQWQRRIRTTSDDVLTGLQVGPSGNLYISGYVYINAIYNYFLAKLPNDGSLTGSYSVGGTTFIYEASTLTDVASTLTDADTTAAATSMSMTDRTPTDTDTTGNLTSNVTLI